MINSWKKRGMAMTQMLDSQAARSYGAALYDLQIPQADIAAARELLEQCPQLKELLCCPVVALEQKLSVIDRIFPASMTGFMKCVCRNRRCELLDRIFEDYEACVHSRKRILTARLRCVTPPDERQLAGISRSLCERYHMQDVDLQVIIDQSLIGGFVIEAGGHEIDYSIHGRFKRLQQKLSGGE